MPTNCPDNDLQLPYQIAQLFGKLKQWSSEYTQAEGMILERAAKTQGFSDYLLKRASEDRDLAQTTE
jgi:hypothetical protein